VRNEAGLIREHLQRLQYLRASGHEIIVVDGGSTDATVEQTKGLVDSCEIAATGRATQMNQGASQATGDIFLFLHVDTQLPANADARLLAALSSAERQWGWFNAELSNPRFAFRIVAFMMNLRARLTSVSTGDQCLFVERGLFQGIGGFPELELMEDIAICKILRRRSSASRPEGMVVTSSRRWEEQGLVSTILLMWKLRLLYFVGVTPQRLREMYYPHHD